MPALLQPYDWLTRRGRTLVQVKGRDAVERTFTFKNFNEAWGFMSRTALLAEKVGGRGHAIAREVKSM